mgnify:CR=1 FL=1
MRIVGIEGVREFGSSGRSNMIVELPTGEQFRVPVGQDTYDMLNELGNIMELHAQGQETEMARLAYQQPQPGDQPATKQRLDRSPQPGQRPQTLEDFAKTFVTGPNVGAPGVPPQMAETQNDLVGQLATLSPEEAVELAGDQQVDDPLSQLRKVGFLGEPEDVLSAMSTPAETPGSDLIESFEDTSDSDFDDPGEEYDEGEMAEQF